MHRKLGLGLVLGVTGGLLLLLSWQVSEKAALAPARADAAIAAKVVRDDPPDPEAGRDASFGAAVPATSSGFDTQEASRGWLPGLAAFAYGQGWSEAGGRSMAAFREWTERYASAPAGGRADLLAEGVRLARARRAEMLELVQMDPQAALALTVPANLRQVLPPEVVAELEERVAGVGDYLVFPHEAEAEGGVPSSALDRLAVINGERFAAHVYGRRAGQLTQEGASLHGIALDGHLALHESPVRVFEPGEIAAGPIEPVGPISGRTSAASPSSEQVLVEAAGRMWRMARPEDVWILADELQAGEDLPGPKVPALEAPSGGEGYATVAAAQATPWTSGVKKVLVVRVDFPDLPGAPVYRSTGQTFTTADWQALFSNDIAPFYAQSSYGGASISGAVTETVYRLPVAAADYARQNRYYDLYADALSAAWAENTSAYDVVAVAFTYIGPARISGSGLSWAGLASIGGSRCWLNGYFDLRTFGHELGHTYGLQHANLWKSTDGDPVSPYGSRLEYGDDFDLMGQGSHPTHHFNEEYKNQLGWLPDSAVQTVSASGNYRIHRFDTAPLVAGRTLALRLPCRDARSYWLGYRKPDGAGTAPAGLYVHWLEDGTSDTRVIDLAPGAGKDVALSLGQTFRDAWRNIAFTVTGQGGSGSDEFIDVQVDIGPAPKLAIEAWGSGSAAAVPVTMKDATAVASGDSHVVALRSDGTAVTWGSTLEQLAVPGSLGQVTAVAAGGSVSAAIRPSRELVMWGWSAYGQLPVPASLGAVRQVSVGGIHVLALLEDGTVRTWGGYDPALSAVPGEVYQPVAVEAGQRSNFVLRADGTVVGWGPYYAAVPAGLSDVVAVSAGEWHTLALRRDGSVVGWGVSYAAGKNVPAGLGNVAAIKAAGRQSFALLADGSVVGWGESEAAQLPVPNGLPPAVALAGGTSHAAALLGSGSATVTVQPWSRQVAAGNSAKFTTLAAGSGGLDFRWQRQRPWEASWADVANAGSYAGANTPTLAVSTGDPAVSGERYRCVVRGTAGPEAYGREVTLLVDGALLGISGEPADARVDAREAAAFSVAPHGEAPFSYQWFKDGVSLSGANGNNLLLSNVDATAAGSYSVRVSNSHGSVFSRAAALVVDKLSQQISFGALPERTFGDAPFAPGAVASSGLPVGYAVSGPASLSGGTLSLTGAGTVTLTASQPGDSFHAAAAEVTRVFTVRKAVAQVALAGLSAVYDGSTKVVTAVTTPAGLNVAVTYGGSPNPPWNAGTYQVSAQISDPNHQGEAAGVLVIQQAVPAVEWVPPAAIDYGTLLGAAQLAATANVPGTFAYEPAAGTLLEVGSGQTLRANFLPSESANYAGVEVSTTITVNRATQSIGFPPIPDQSASQTSLSLTATASSGLPVSYSVSGPAALAGNLLVFTGTGAVVVTARQAGDAHFRPAADVTRSFAVSDAQALILLDGLARVYTGGAQTVSFTTVPAGLDVSIRYNGSPTAPKDAGSYDVVATIEDASYSGIVTSSLEIQKAPLVVRALDQTRAYGASNPVLALQYSGFVGGESAAALAQVPVATTSATADSPVGEYPILVGGGVAANYAIQRVPGTLRVTQAGVAISILDTEQVHDGQPRAVRVSTVPGGLPVTVTYNGSTVPPSAAGQYEVVASVDDVNYSGAATAMLSISAGAQLVNLSARSLVGVEADIMIPGFVVRGAGTKKLLIRGLGPTLATDFGVGNALVAPTLTLISDVTGASVGSNTGWSTAPNAAEIQAAAALVGAYPLAPGSGDCAILIDVPPGPYTAQLKGVNNTTGVGLVEIYGVDGASSSARLVNISTRSRVGVGADILIPGYVIEGDVPRTLLIRAVGPTLGAPPYNVNGVLVDPQLQVFMSLPDGSQQEVGVNDNWGSNGNVAQIQTVTNAVGAFELLEGSKDAAVLLTLEPGVYTVQVSGVNQTKGVSLVEVYELEE